jgi:hypothetical protein
VIFRPPIEWTGIMAKDVPRSGPGPGPEPRLDAVTAAAAGGLVKGAPPVHLWNPPFCGDIDMRIAADGTWFYHGTPIGRPALVRLFASILRRDADRFVLVTPVEKVGIRVEDAPFVAVEMQVKEGARGRVLRFRTNVDEWVSAGAAHPLRFEKGAADGLKPYVLVRDELWALVKRAVFYDLVALGSVERTESGEMFGVASDGVFFPMASAGAIGCAR